MPIYEFDCPEHGVFEAMRPLAEYKAPCPCPSCGTSSARVMLSLPQLATMDAGRRHAHATNERSADSPKSTRTHGPGCSCCSGQAKGKSRKTLYRPDGSKSFPSARPWMISH